MRNQSRDSEPAINQRPIHSPQNNLLLTGGIFSIAFAIFQVSAILWTPAMVEYFGGPVQMQAQQPVAYALSCALIGLVVAVCGLYAFSGAGKYRRLPFMKSVLVAVTAVYLLRGLMIITDMIAMQKSPLKPLTHFLVYSSIALFIGIVHLGGVVKLFKK